MALKSTIFKAELNVADMDRQVYGDFTLTLARHPSETDARMMVRLLCFALHADTRLEFTRGLSTDDEPDLWQRSLSDEIELWIELGQPEEKRIRKACGRARQVLICTFQSRSARVWWQQQADALQRYDNLTVVNIDDSAVDALTGLATRNMQIQCTIQDSEVLLSSDDHSLTIRPQNWKLAGT